MNTLKEQQKQELIAKLRGLGLNQGLFVTLDTVEEVFDYTDRFSGGEKAAAMVAAGMMFNALTLELARKGLLNITKEPLKAHEHLVDYALAQGLVINVFDNESFCVKRDSDRKRILAGITSVDSSSIQIRDINEDIMGWADIILEGNELETVVNYSTNPFMKTWYKVWRDSHEDSI